MASYIRVPIGAEDSVGQVFTDLVVSNNKDENLAEDGHLDPSQVRRIELTRVLVDTGATVLCLPRPLIEQLGLPLKERVVATTAAGDIETEVYTQAIVRVGERSALVDCLALPADVRPLLGVIPLEVMGLEPDTTNHVLRVLPNDTKDTHILAY